MHHAYRTAVAIVCLSLAGTAHGQSFLKRLAERAVRQAEQSIANATRRAPERAEPVRTDAPARTEAAAPRAVPSTTPARAKAIRYIGDIPAPDDLAAQKSAYDKFGEISCNDCEGGIDFDGRPRFESDQFSGQHGERARRAGNWPVGHVHRWQGKSAAGSLMVISEERIEGFRCRRLEYKLVKGAQSVVRPSLICWGLASGESSVENWHEVY